MAKNHVPVLTHPNDDGQIKAASLKIIHERVLGGVGDVGVVPGCCWVVVGVFLGGVGDAGQVSAARS